MKSLFTVISILFALTASAAPSPYVPKPKHIDPPTVIIDGSTVKLKDQLEGLLKGRPIVLIGDWNSSGAPEIPYKPAYEFSYRCQAQMTDQISRQNEFGFYGFFAVADFQITNEKTSFTTDELTWFGKKIYQDHTVMDTDDKIPFSLNGSAIGLYFRSSADQNDRINLVLNLEQLVGSVIISEQNRIEGHRNDSGLSGSVAMDLRSKDDMPMPVMNLKVQCTKEK
jgi:hypothetical protein